MESVQEIRKSKNVILQPLSHTATILVHETHCTFMFKRHSINNNNIDKICCSQLSQDKFTVKMLHCLLNITYQCCCPSQSQLSSALRSLHAICVAFINPNSCFVLVLVLFLELQCSLLICQFQITLSKITIDLLLRTIPFVSLSFLLSNQIYIRFIQSFLSFTTLKLLKFQKD